MKSLVGFAAAFSICLYAREASAQAHTVSAPNTPSGVTNVTHGTSALYATGGGKCSLGHPILANYQFYWGDGSYSGFGGGSQWKVWPNPGVWTVRAQARCSAGVISSWSGGLGVTVRGPTAPATPSGLTNVTLGSTCLYQTGGGSCPAGHAIVRYEFYWGTDGRSSGGAAQYHKWAKTGPQYVRAYAYCSAGAQSLSSGSLVVTVR